MIGIAILVSFGMYQAFRSDFPNFAPKVAIGFAAGMTLLLFLLGWIAAELWWISAIFNGIVVAYLGIVIHHLFNLFSEDIEWLGEISTYFSEFFIKICIIVALAGIILVERRNAIGKKSLQEVG